MPFDISVFTSFSYKALYKGIAYAYNSIESIMLNDDSVRASFVAIGIILIGYIIMYLLLLSKTSKKKFYL